MLERDLERGLIEHLRSLILELGKGFAFVGSQYHLEVGGRDYYLDLLFYHLRLRCFVVIELKIEDFKPEFAGKMNFYLSAVDEQLRHPDDKPTIGIILCKGRNRVMTSTPCEIRASRWGWLNIRFRRRSSSDSKRSSDGRGAWAGIPAHVGRQLRIEIERALRELIVAKGIDPRRMGISQMKQSCKARGFSSQHQACAASCNPCSRHRGVDVERSDAAKRAVEIGTAFLADLRTINADD